MGSKKIKLQQFRVNDLIQNPGKQIEFGKAWHEDYFGIPKNSGNTTLNLKFKALSKNHSELNNHEIELTLSASTKRDDRKVYNSNSYNGMSQLKDFFINQLKLTTNDNLEDYFAFYKLDNGDYYLFYIPKLLKDNFVELFQSDEIAFSIERRSENNFNINYDNLSLQIIYYGAPGTGKSHEINKLTKGKSVIRTTFHPDSDYSTFVGAYKPTMGRGKVYGSQGPLKNNNGEDVEDDRITYTFVKQAFLKAYLSAWKKLSEATESVNPQFLIIEEINRGNCAQIFGDLFQLLDRSNNKFSTYPIEADSDLQSEIAKAFISEGEYKLGDEFNVGDVVEGYVSNYGCSLSEDIQKGRILLLPSNLYIWATMNTSDQSLFPIDSAFKRRWDWRYRPISDGKEGWSISVGTSKYDWWSFLEKINEKIYSVSSSEDKMLGYFFTKPDEDESISADKFLGKVIFYLWNDVFKDYSDGLFCSENKEKLTFQEFYNADGSPNIDKVKAFLVNLGLNAIDMSENTDIAEEIIADNSTEMQLKRKEYWTKFFQYATQKTEYASVYKTQYNPTKEIYFNFPLGKSGCNISVQQIRTKEKLVVEVYIQDNKSLYEKFLLNKKNIEESCGFVFEWEEKAQTKCSRIGVSKQGVKFDDSSKWNEQFDYIINKVLKMKEAFTPYLK